MREQRSFYDRNYQKDMMSMSTKYDMFIRMMQRYAPAAGSFLDVGCGDGSFMAAVRERLQIERIFGCDISAEACRAVNERGAGQAHEVNTDERDLPFDDDSFDMIFCGEVIEHVYKPEHLAGELYRVCSSEGVIFLTTPNMGSWFNRISLLMGYMPIFCDLRCGAESQLWASVENESCGTPQTVYV